MPFQSQTILNNDPVYWKKLNLNFNIHFLILPSFFGIFVTCLKYCRNQVIEKTGLEISKQGPITAHLLLEFPVYDRSCERIKIFIRHKILNLEQCLFKLLHDLTNTITKIVNIGPKR